MHVKFAEEADDLVVGLAAPNGGPFNGRDVDGEYFSKSTDFCEDWFPESRPLLFHHGMDEEAGVSVVGRVKSWNKDDAGLWVQAQLDRNSKYFESIKKLVGDSKLFFSSGAMGHLVDIGKSGEIKRWPWVELSLTPTPANPYASLDFATAKSHYKAAGLDLDEDAIKAVLSSKERDALDDSDFAYIDSAGDRHLPIHDEAHVRAALSRFNQTSFDSDAAKTKAKKKIDAAAKKFGIDVSDEGDDKGSGKSGTLKAMGDGSVVDSTECSYEDIISDLRGLLNPSGPFSSYSYSGIVATYPSYVIVCRYDDMDGNGYGDCDPTYWKVAYSIGDDMEPRLGDAIQIEQTYVPAAKSADRGVAPLSLDVHGLSRHAAAVVERTKDLHTRRTKEGRVLSDANRRTLADAHDKMGAAHKALSDLLDATDRMKDEQAKAAHLSDPEVQRRQRELRDLELTLLGTYAS